MTEQIPLEHSAAVQFEELPLAVGFDALGDDCDVQAVAQRDDGMHDRRVTRLAGQFLHEGLVDLDLVEGQLLQVGKAGIAGAEIVERESDA